MKRKIPMVAVIFLILFCTVSLRNELHSKPVESHDYDVQPDHGATMRHSSTDDFDGIPWGIDIKSFNSDYSKGRTTRLPTQGNPRSPFKDPSEGGIPLSVPGIDGFTFVVFTSKIEGDAYVGDKLEKRKKYFFIGDNDNGYEMGIGHIHYSAENEVLRATGEEILAGLTMQFGAPHDKFNYENHSDYFWDFKDLRILYFRFRPSMETIIKRQRIMVRRIPGTWTTINVVFYYKPVLQGTGYVIPSLPIAEDTWIP